MTRPSARRLATALALLVLAAGAAGLRLLAAPGADLDAAAREMLGRAPRLDAYWYTRAAVDRARGQPSADVPAAFDRPLYTWYCRTVFALTGTGERALAAPSIAAGAATAAAVVLLGRACGLGAASWLAGLFAATSWISLLHDREPLVYSTVNLAFLLAVLAWARGLHRAAWFVPAWLAVTAAALAGKETVLLGAPALLAGHVLAHARTRRARAAAAAAAAAAGAAAAGLAWLLAPDLARAGAHKLAARFTLPDLPFPSGWVAALGDLPSTLAVIGRVPALAALAAVGVIAVALAGEGERSDRAHLLRRVLVLWLATGCTALAALSYRPTRYALGLFPPAFVLAAYGARVLWEERLSPLRLRGAARAAVLAVIWWLGLAGLLAWAGSALHAPRWETPVRLAVAAALATFVALTQSAALERSPCLPASSRWAAALVAFVLVTDARGFLAHLRPVTRDDLAARRTFAACVGPGARVQGYAAHYLAVSPAYRVAFDFSLRPAALAAAPATHLATLWVPELSLVERQMQAAGTPLHAVVDVVIGRERYRVYRLPAADRLGYALTPFERAQLAGEREDVAGAARLFSDLVAAGADDPAVLAYAGSAIARVDAGAGFPLLARAGALAPRNGVIAHLAAGAAAEAGSPDLAASLLARAAALLPHELLAGLGVRPQRRGP
jgi:hypothetical protein